MADITEVEYRCARCGAPLPYRYESVQEYGAWDFVHDGPVYADSCNATACVGGIRSHEPVPVLRAPD